MHEDRPAVIDTWIGFRTALAEWSLGRKPIEEIPGAAVEALVHGANSPTLAILAGMEGASWSEIRPVLDAVVHEIGGPLGERDAKVLVADAWLARLAAGELGEGLRYDYELTEEVLWHLGGEYEWFRLALYDLEVLDALDQPEALNSARSEMRERAGRVLRMSADDRLSARAPGLDERPFLNLDQ